MLEAQRGGADRVWLHGAGVSAPWLADPRVRIPVDLVERAPERARPYDEVAGVRLLDEATWREAERRLVEACRKPTDGWVSRHLNRPLSLWLSRRLARRDVRPNTMTAVALAVALVGALLVARATYASMALGAGLVHLSSVLDGCDGELARLTHRSSTRGAWLDTIADDVTHLAYWAALAVAARALGATHWPLGWFAAGANAAAAALTYRELLRVGRGDWFAVSPTSPHRLVAGVTSLFRRDAFLFGLWLAAIAGQLVTALPVVAFGATVTLVAAVVQAAQKPKRK